MSIPLDRLYNFLEVASDYDIIIYRWYPHGSKKLENLSPLKKYDRFCYHWSITPMVICHDQEPLDFNQYSKNQIIQALIARAGSDNLKERPSYLKEYNLRSNWNLRAFLNYYNIYDYTILLHSEKNSSEIQLYSAAGFIPVYYWCHAIIAIDWYRYACHDPALKACNNQVDFLVYNRAWAGTREYRLKFAELVVKKHLTSRCRMGFSTVDQEIDYRQHTFKNTKFSISINNLETYFTDNCAPSTSSADYVTTDYQDCGIEIVLETLFDDSRLHLTEKTLRPIACGKPFILAATAGSLSYLREYGFKTFGDYFDESYDLISDPTLRLEAITDLMLQLSNLDSEKKSNLYANIAEICQYNQRRFFSEDFLNQIIDEYRSNMAQGIQCLKNQSNGQKFNEIMNFIHEHDEDISKEIDVNDLIKIKQYLQILN